jgi:hypothetical protein
MKITMKDNKLKKIKAALEIIKEKAVSEPKSDTFEFGFENFIPEKSEPVLGGLTIFATEIERISLRRMFERIQKENSGIKFVFPESTKKQINTFSLSQLEVRELAKPTFFINIEDTAKFDKYQKKIEQQLKERVPALILNKEGTLYRIDDKERKFVYQMGSNGLRYDLVRYLVAEKRYVQTAELAREFEKSLPQIRKTIAEIRKLITKKLKIPGDKIVETGAGGGYRTKNIKTKED